MGRRSDDLTLELKRIVPAAPSVVFTAFSDALELAKWWGPRGFTTPSIEFEPRVGESYRIEMQPPEGDHFSLTGVFLEVAPPARLAYTFVWEEPDPDDVENRVSDAILVPHGGPTHHAVPRVPRLRGYAHLLHASARSRGGQLRRRVHRLRVRP